MEPILRTRTTLDNQPDGFPAPPGVRKNFVNPVNACLSVIPAGWTLITIAILLVFLRLVAKLRQKHQKIQLDDCKSKQQFPV